MLCMRNFILKFASSLFPTYLEQHQSPPGLLGERMFCCGTWCLTESSNSRPHRRHERVGAFERTCVCLFVCLHTCRHVGSFSTYLPIGARLCAPKSKKIIRSGFGVVWQPSSGVSPASDRPADDVPSAKPTQSTIVGCECVSRLAAVAFFVSIDIWPTSSYSLKALLFYVTC